MGLNDFINTTTFYEVKQTKFYYAFFNIFWKILRMRTQKLKSFYIINKAKYFVCSLCIFCFLTNFESAYISMQALFLYPQPILKKGQQCFQQQNGCALQLNIHKPIFWFKEKIERSAFYFENKILWIQQTWWLRKVFRVYRIGVSQSKGR